MIAINTPIEKYFFNKIAVDFKREDLNVSGSWKDRGTEYKLEQLLKLGIYEVVLFSSGNALISLLEFAKKIPNFKVHAVVSKNITEVKLARIQSLINENANHVLYISENPKKEAISISAKLKIPNLRISIDNDIVKGYWSLGEEIGKFLKSQKEFKQQTINQVCLFIPASSGTAAVGCAEGIFSILEEEFLMPRIFICQTQSVHPFANEIVINDEKSLADAIVDTVGLRKEQIHKIVKTTNGRVLIIDNEYLRLAKEEYKRLSNSDASYNSLLSFAGFLKVQNEVQLSRAICILSGL
jgi:threonine dehydratase